MSSTMQNMSLLRKADLNKGQRVRVTISDVTAEGEGVTQLGEVQLIVRGLRPESQAEVEIEHISPHKPIAWGKLVHVVQKGRGPDKLDCPSAVQSGGGCDGCAWLALAESDQRRASRLLLEEALGDRAAEVALNPKGFAALGYRNRTNWEVARAGEQVVLGSRQRRSRNVQSMRDCAVVEPALRQAWGVVREFLLEHQDAPLGADERGLRHVAARSGEEGVLLEFIVCSESLDVWLGRLQTWRVPRPIVGVLYSEHDGRGNTLRQRPPQSIQGSSYVGRNVAGLPWRLGSDTFFQLNTATAETMVRAAQEWIDEEVEAGSLCASATRSSDRATVVLWDLYCGVGLLGLGLAHGRDWKVWGADRVAGGIQDAQANARSHGIDAHYGVADLAEGVPDDWPEPQVIIINPPRRGLDPRSLATLANYPDALVLYMSCGPKSFARDLAALEETGRRLLRLEAFDMLPQTAHLELLGLLSGSSVSPQS